MLRLNSVKHYNGLLKPQQHNRNIVCDVTCVVCLLFGLIIMVVASERAHCFYLTHKERCVKSHMLRCALAVMGLHAACAEVRPDPQE